MRLGKLRIGLARFTEEIPRSKMCRPRDLMEEPGTLVHEIPPRHVTHTASSHNGKADSLFSSSGSIAPQPVR